MKKQDWTFFSLAFVWFSVHFGGGFSSGRQPVSFFLDHHWTGFFMPAISMAVTGLTIYFGWIIAAKHQSYDYASWAKKVYYPSKLVLPVLHGVVLNTTMILATAVAFATSGKTIEAMLGTSYLANTVVVGIFIFVLTIFGAGLVRKFATVVSLFMICCILTAYLPNIIKFYPKIMANLDAMKAATATTSSAWESLWWALKYGGLQGCAIGAYIVHAQACPDRGSLAKAAITGFLLNAGILYLACFGIMAFADQGALTESVPSLFVVTHGIGKEYMPILLSVTLILASLSTGVALAFGVAKRIVVFLARNMNSEEQQRNEQKHFIIASLGLLIVCWAVAQFGLIPLVAKGFGAVGWMALIVISLPVMLRGFGLWSAEEPSSQQ